MTNKAYGFTEREAVVLRDLVARVHMDSANLRQRSHTPEHVSGAPDVYVVYTPSEGVPGLSGSGNPGVAACEVYQIVYIGTSTLPELIDTGNQVDVFNIDCVATPGDSWAVVTRDKFGSWLIVDVAEAQCNTTSTSTTTACGVCDWQWSNYLQKWVEIASTCNGTTCICPYPSCPPTTHGCYAVQVNCVAVDDSTTSTSTTTPDCATTTTTTSTTSPCPFCVSNSPCVFTCDESTNMWVTTANCGCCNNNSTRTGLRYYGCGVNQVPFIVPPDEEIPDLVCQCQCCALFDYTQPCSPGEIGAGQCSTLFVPYIYDGGGGDPGGDAPCAAIPGPGNPTPNGDGFCCIQACGAQTPCDGVCLWIWTCTSGGDCTDPSQFSWVQQTYGCTSNAPWYCDCPAPTDTPTDTNCHIEVTHCSTDGGSTTTPPYAPCNGSCFLQCVPGTGWVGYGGACQAITDPGFMGQCCCPIPHDVECCYSTQTINAICYNVASGLCGNNTTSGCTFTTTTSTTSTTTTPSSPCGTCTYTCTSDGWTQTSDTCTGGCSCSEPGEVCDSSVVGTESLVYCGMSECGTCDYECHLGSWELLTTACTGACTCRAPTASCTPLNNGQIVTTDCA